MAEIGMLDRAFAGLAEPAAGLYRALAWCPARFLEMPAVAAIAGCSVAEARALSGSLIEAGLVRRAAAPGGSGLRIMLGPAGHFHAATLEPAGGGAEACSRWIDYLLGCAAIVEERVCVSRPAAVWGRPAPEVAAVPFGPSAGEGVRWLREQWPNFLLVIRWAGERGRFDVACTLAAVLRPLWLWVRPVGTIETLELGLAAAVATGSSPAITFMRAALAEQLRSNPAEAWRAFELDQAVKQAAEQDGDEVAVAGAVAALGEDVLAAGLLDMAEEYFTAAEQVRAALGVSRSGLARRGRARVAAARGEIEVAVDLLRQAQEMLEPPGDLFDRLLIGAEIGVMRARLGELEPGLAEIEAARAGLEAAGAEHGQVIALTMLAGTLESAGRCAAAVKARLRAADLLDALDPAAASRLRAAA